MSSRQVVINLIGSVTTEHGLQVRAAAEREVLRLVAQGLDNGAIARQLKKGEKTVRHQVSSIFDKLGVRTRAEAIVHVRDRDARP